MKNTNLLEDDVENDDAADFDGTKQDGEIAFWNMKYYERFFNVDTKEVIARVVSSFIPNYNGSVDLIRRKPDLYGPFWICVTLVITVTVSGNINSYLHSAGSKFHWVYDFNLASFTSIVALVYMIIIPLALWGLFRNKINQESEHSIPKVLELICIYGYSLVLYIPVAVLWPIRVLALQLSILALAFVLSLTVLFYRLAPVFLTIRCGIVYMIITIVIHLVLMSSFMVYTPSFQNVIANITSVNKTI